jgi:Tol biopolymer transport system component
MTSSVADKTVVQTYSVREKKVTALTPNVVGTFSTAPAFSSDGKWIAYGVTVGSNPTMTFIEPVPATGAKYQIGPGNQPVWSPDGSELLVNSRTPEMTLYRVATTPRVVFSQARSVQRAQAITPNSGPRQYDFTPDGKRLLVVAPAGARATPNREITVVLNWIEELKGLK